MQTESLGFLIVDVSRLLRRRFDAALEAAGLGITAGEARTLHHADRTGPVRQTTLAERMAVEPMTLVGYLDRLERIGLVRREPDPADRRAKLVVIEPAARPVLARIATVAAAVREGAMEGLSAEEAEAVRAALALMRVNLRAGPAASDHAQPGEAAASEADPKP